MDKLSALARLSLLLGLTLAGTAASAATTVTVTPSSVVPGGTVTAAWSGIPAPSVQDWLGLYTPGASDFAYLSWRYLNVAAASGSVPYTVYGGIAPGTYQLRLFSNNTYAKLATSNNFTVSVVVSGITQAFSGAMLSGVTFAATNGGTCTNSNASGQYSCAVPPGWSGSITPSRAGYIFTTPASRNYTNVTTHQTGQNFYAAVAFQVSGTVTVGGTPLAGVAFAATNGVTCTNSNASGQYSCSVPQGWSGGVTPSLSGYTFTPASRNYTNVTAHQTAQNYAAVIFQVSGTVTIGGSPLVGVAFAATNGGSCTSSNTSGQYSCTVVTGWSGSVTPTLSGYTFTPPSRSHIDVTSNQTGQDYAATASGASAAIYYIHPDHLNTPRVITNQTAQVVWRWDHAEPFGSNPPNENPSGLGTFTSNLRLPGQYFDKETNLHYNWNRWYDAATGRYPQADPLGIVLPGVPTPPRKLNQPYAYADNNPLSNVDPLGLCPCAGGTWDQEVGDFQFNVGAGGYFSVGNVNLTCRSDPSLKCSGKQLSVGVGTPNLGVSWSMGGVVFGAGDSNNLSGWSGSGLFDGWSVGAQGGIFQGQISLSGQGGGTALGSPRGVSGALFRSLNYYMKCNCLTCPPPGAQQ